MKTMTGWAKLLYFAWLIVIPFLAQVVFVTGTRALSNLGPGLGDIGFVTPALSAVVGFVFATRFLSGSQKILVGLLYFPVMYVLLMLFSLGFIGFTYGDWL